MGLLSGITNTFKKSKAAVVVQNLLEHQAEAGNLEADPAKLANGLVTLVWDQKSDLLGGKFGQRPHKISIAAAALANGIEQIGPTSPIRNALIISVGNLLSEIETNGAFYPLNGIDQALIESASSVFLQATDMSEPSAPPASEQPPSLSDRCKAAVDIASMSLKMQITLGGGTAETFARDDFALGYLFGFKDAILLAMGIKDELKSLAALAASFHTVFASEGPSLLGRSMDLQGTDAFDRGRALGGEEAFAFVRQSTTPMGLASHLRKV